MQLGKRQGDLATPVLRDELHHLPGGVAPAHRTQPEPVLSSGVRVCLCDTSEDPGSTVRTLLLTPRSEILGVIYLLFYNVRTNLKEVEIFKVLAKEKPRSALFGHTA